MKQYCVCLLAHNEANGIAACLQSLPLDDTAFQFYLISNGSHDATVAIAQGIMKGHDNCHVVDLPQGGKSRSWNHYVYEIMPEDALLYFFMDGDTVIKSGSLQAMVTSYEANSAVNAVVALPLNGRHMHQYQQVMYAERSLAGDLYALSPDFLKRIKKHNYKLPADLIGDDGMLGSWAKTDLGKDENWNIERINVCAEAGFYSELIVWTNPRLLKLQFKRMISYSLRRYQNLAVSVIMQTEGVCGLPEEINPHALHRVSVRDVRFHPLHFVPDCIALWRLKLND